MAHFMEFRLANGGTLRIQTAAQVKSGKDDETMLLEDALATVQQTAGQMLKTFKDLNIEELELSFGLAADEEDGGLLVSRNHAQASFAVKLRWRSTHPASGGVA